MRTLNYIPRLLFPCMRFVVLVGAILVFASFAFAHEGIDWDSLNCVTATYEGKPVEDAAIPLPKELANFMNDEVVRLTIEGKSATGHVEKGIMHTIRCESIEDETLSVSMSKDSVQKIVESAYPLKTFKQLKEEKVIDVTPHAPLTMVKIFFLNLALFFA